ncbi:uncharacterized protein LOC133187993 [Saccostrea echinata]|uniref:uncharacterized protein LOC133187993 n=1 Tax=Saccostrea echinata TaxID=191078 RepID=UPI002A830EA8|nr:uncharacterized protein LOC133187993 [Saccostrea echinata]
MCFKNVTGTQLRVLVWVGFVVGCIAKFVTGSLFVYNVYQDDIKQTFNFSQKDMEIQPSLLNLGLGVGFLPGMLYDKYGPTVTSIAGLFVSVGSYMLLWSTTRYVDFYKTAGGLVGVYFMICGLGSVFTYMVALNTNVINFSDKHRGKIVGGLNCFFAGSPSVFSVIYYHLVQKTNQHAESFASFMAFFAVLFAIVDIICALFLRVYNKTDEVYTVDPSEIINEHQSKDETPMKNMPRHDSQNESDCCAPSNLIPVEPKSLKEILVDLDFYLLTGMFSCASSVGLIYLNNLTVISKSVHLDYHDQDFVLIIPITNAILSISIGLASDYFQEKIQRMVIIFLTCFLYVGLSVLAMFLGDNYAALCIATALCGMGTGIIWSLSPTVMSEMFHISNLGRNWGIALLCAALVGMAGQYSFGALYDEKKPENELFCYGLHCVSGGLGICVGLAVAAVIFGIVLILHRKFRISRLKAQKS